MPVTDNIFDLKTPQLYRCHVHRYHSTLSRLYVRAFKGQSQDVAFYLLFSDVGYFEGPINWVGANFQMHPPEECFAMMIRSGMVDAELMQDAEVRAHFAETVHLYVLVTPQAQLKIIAGSAALLESVPENI